MRTGQSRWDEGQSRWGGSAAPAWYPASKVPLITAYFWIIKLLSTAMGEATSDYMVRTINPVIAVLFGFTGFVIAMVLQFRAKAYNAWIYWLAVVMVAVFGTQAADVLHIKFGVPYIASTTFYAIVLAVIFILWYRTEGTLSIHSIRTPRREVFYWATVLATFALGTATGDLTARTLHLGYLTSGIWFSIAFAMVAVAHWKFRLNPILAFWIAYVLTRPVGASFADYVAFPHSVGGLGVGHGPVALALTVVIVILVAYLAVTRKDVEDPRQAPDSAASSRYSRAGQQQPGYPPRSRSMPPHAARPDPPLRYPGQYPDERYPGEQYQGQRGSGRQYPEERYAGEQRHGQRYPGEQYPEEQYAGERYQGQRYPGEQYPEERYPGQPHPAAPGSSMPPRRSGPPSRSAPPQQPPEPRPPQERRPSRQSGQAPEPWPDEDEAEQTAWGFFMWDE
ncbi:MAG TPA: hypothetical protein VGI05_00995 [Streptosporangiaceae bacterium]|jgi:uncharacterized membrane-anchored protein